MSQGQFSWLQLLEWIINTFTAYNFFVWISRFFRILYIILGQKKAYGTEETQYDPEWVFHTCMMIFKIGKKLSIVISKNFKIKKT